MGSSRGWYDSFQVIPSRYIMRASKGRKPTRDGRRRLEADVVAAFTETAQLLDRKEQELETLRQFKVRADERMAAQEEHIASLMNCLSTRQHEGVSDARVVQHERALLISDGVSAALQDKLERMTEDHQAKEAGWRQQEAGLRQQLAAQQSACSNRVEAAESKLLEVELELSWATRQQCASPQRVQTIAPASLEAGTDSALGELLDALQHSQLRL